MLFCFKKILSLTIAIIIAISSPLALASQSCCDVSSVEKTQKPVKMKCHEITDISKSEKTKTSGSNEKNDNCNCNCGVCKVSFYNLPKIIKTALNYPQKYYRLNSQVSQKALSYGIFTPPKIS